MSSPNYNLEVSVQPASEQVIISMNGTPLDPANLNELPAETVGTPVQEIDFVASGGVGPYTFDTTGTVPPGMQLQSNDVDTLRYTGTPTTDGTFDFGFSATDTQGNTASASVKRNVLKRPNAPPAPKK